MKRRALIFYASAFASVAAIVGLTVAIFGERSGAIPVIAIVWLVVVGVAQFWWLKCPYCHNPAIITPGGIATPSVGDTCRHCGKPY